MADNELEIVNRLKIALVNEDDDTLYDVCHAAFVLELDPFDRDATSIDVLRALIAVKYDVDPVDTPDEYDDACKYNSSWWVSHWYKIAQSAEDAS